MQEMLRKKYRLELEFFGRFNRPKTIYFVFEQARLRDLLEMKEEIHTPEKLKAWIQDFLMKKTSQSDKLTLKLYQQLGTDQRMKIFEFLLDTYAKGFFKPKMVQSDDEQKTFKKTYEAPTSSMISLILEKSGENMESVLNMTWEQIDYLTEGIVWNLNAQTKEGVKRNERHMRLKDLSNNAADDELDQIKQLEERINKKLKK
jgi:hypothetical protein